MKTGNRETACLASIYTAHGLNCYVLLLESAHKSTRNDKYCVFFSGYLSHILVLLHPGQASLLDLFPVFILTAPWPDLHNSDKNQINVSPQMMQSRRSETAALRTNHSPFLSCQLLKCIPVVTVHNKKHHFRFSFQAFKVILLRPNSQSWRWRRHNTCSVRPFCSWVFLVCRFNACTVETSDNPFFLGRKEQV